MGLKEPHRSIAKQAYWEAMGGDPKKGPHPDETEGPLNQKPEPSVEKNSSPPQPSQPHSDNGSTADKNEPTPLSMAQVTANTLQLNIKAQEIARRWLGQLKPCVEQNSNRIQIARQVQSPPPDPIRIFYHLVDMNVVILEQLKVILVNSHNQAAQDSARHSPNRR